MDDDSPPPRQRRLRALVRRVARYLRAVSASASPQARAACAVGMPFLLSFAAAAWMRRRLGSAPALREVPLSDFVRLVKDDAVRSVAVGAGGLIYAQLSDAASAGASAAASATAGAAASIIQTRLVPLPPQLTELLLERGVRLGTLRPSALARAVQGVLVAAPIVYLGVISAMLWRMVNEATGGGGAGGGSVRADELVEAGPAVTFDDIAGMASAKVQVMEVCDCLRNPARYRAAGARCPRGLLLVGPPGTGKTLLARAIASSARAAYIACAGSDFVEVFVGRGASRVRRLFERARALAPSVIFVDELDALGRQRAGGGGLLGGGGGGGGGGGSEEHDHAVNALLAEMDGFTPAAGVLVVGATNRYSLLDEALVRPGRFDRVVRLSLPNATERAAILAVHVRKVVLADGVRLDAVAASTAGFSGAELSNLVNEAAFTAVRRGRAAITTDDFGEALRAYLASRGRSGARVSTVEQLDGDSDGSAADESGLGSFGERANGGGGADEQHAMPISPALIASLLQQMAASARSATG